MVTSKSKSSNKRKVNRRKGERREWVNHPQHYGGEDNPYEVIKVLEAWGLDFDFNLGNCVKYIARAGKKQQTKIIEDLKKAAWYLNRRIERLQGASNVRS